MATSTLYERFTLNESEVKQIISTPRTQITEINVFNDVKLTKEERVAHSANILKSRKCRS
ncbi:hypothetical protein [Bacillus sp. V3-13]|uniref:hypothetical protein n=1 Tax=Bacillus sp. V3-13 TaxID=2053728 RepID=UPI001159082C|nr:hypothetical protein [Bacillus sp. V3-13]